MGCENDAVKTIVSALVTHLVTTLVRALASGNLMNAITIQDMANPTPVEKLNAIAEAIALDKPIKLEATIVIGEKE